VASKDSIASIRGGSIAYKPELDGLRAVAVAGVVAFHLDKFKGGFLGVDIFFVLSGYLITRVLLANSHQEKFFSNFYKKRYFRLFPILLANVLIASLILLLIDRKFYGEYVLRTILYLRNIFWSTNQGHDLWLHTWSLSAEEQFYLLYPLILFFCWKKIKNKKLIAILFASYFLICQLINQTHYAFSAVGALNWSIITRPSGLALGCAIGVLSQLKIPPKRSYLYIFYALVIPTGILALILQSSFWIDVMTAVLILSFEPFSTSFTRNIFSKLLAIRPLPYLGRLSYSIYIWHPIVIFTVFHFWSQPSLLRGGSAVLLTLVASISSFHLVEIPINSYLVSRFIK
jgi:hypothetical protein